ncbi:hypothetical protein FO519_003131 [Halicephalobus sp. NKZ332]|nr:hypothetical protein FO519_003131 [Halicephalobus sp. NKZ332]
MNTKVVAIFLVFLVFTVQADDFCTLCKNVIDGVKKQYNNDFSNVSQDQLVSTANSQCDANSSGLTDTLCKGFVKQNAAKLLTALKAGETSQQCCAQGGLC